MAVFQEHEMRALAREEERWVAYRALVEEARQARAKSDHAAWVASIQALPPMGIAVPLDARHSLQPSPSVASLLFGPHDSKEADPLKTFDTRFCSEGGGTNGHFSQSTGDKMRKKQKTL
jgi:hypothetical protein